jgi:hypothetical protein
MEVTSNYYTPWSPDAPPDWKMHNKGITPIFFTETVKLFELDGKTPRHGPDGKCTREQEYVRILIAGDGLCEAAHIVDDLLRERFADEYSAWKENRETAHQGFSLEEWPPLFGKQKAINELNANNIFSVKDLAALADVHLHAISHGRELREKAIAYLADKEGHAVTDKLAEQNAAMAGELEALRRQMAKMEAERKPKRKKQMSGAMRRKLNEARIRKAPVPPTEQPSPTEAA